MKKALARFAIFLLPIITVGVVLEVVLRRLPNDFKYKKAQMEQRYDKIETLIMGGSHTYYGVDPEQFDSETFNLAYVSQSLFFDYLLLEKYIDSLPALKDVVLMIAHASLTYMFSEGEEDWRKFNYYRYYDIAPPSNQWYHKYYLEILNLPVQRSIKKVYQHYLLHKNLVSATPTGWCDEYHMENSLDLERTGKEEADKHDSPSLDFTWNLGNLRKIIDLCAKRGIRVHAVNFPTYVSYRENLNPVKYNMVIDTCSWLSREFENVYHFKMDGDPRFTAKDFYDGDHLNDAGALKCSQLLNNYLESIKKNPASPHDQKSY
jgi:hypothetical protein